MVQRFFMVAAVVFTLVCRPPSLSAQDDTGPFAQAPFAQASKRQGGLHDLLTPADKAKRAPLPPRAEREKAMAQVRGTDKGQASFGPSQTPRELCLSFSVV